MGYNTVLIVLNDTMAYGENDPNLGRSIVQASRGWSHRHDSRQAASISAKIGELGGAQYGAVISQDHADGYQVTVVHGNMGWRIDDPAYDKHLGLSAVEQMKACLERLGYKIAKPKARPPHPGKEKN